MKSLAELLNLQDKSAIVTGGAKGIGLGIAYRLAEAGAKVLIADIDELEADKSAQQLVDKGWQAQAIVTDVSSEEDIKEMIKYCHEQFGSVDILVNNAGIYPPTPISDMTSQQFDKVIAVNLRSTFLATKYAGEVMKQQKSGNIINITSVDALHPSMIGLAHYDASKHGMWGFTKNSALELAEHNIRVNAIAPGGIATPGVADISRGGPDNDRLEGVESPMENIPLKRMGESDEIGTVALFLASDLSSYMTGEQVVVDGGLLVK